MSTVRSAHETLFWDDVEVGDELPPLDLEITATLIAAGAIATRDFMPVHHDKQYANTQGAPDIFMNILSDNAYCSRFLTDWAGPEAMLRKISIRLGAPTFPGSTLHYTGTVQAKSLDGDHGVVTVALQATNEIGVHVSGTADLRLPRRATP
ncbi:MAG TPA: MaoC family dehydratase [Ilumatobacteraceae bacterium]